ncbi:TetR/AcrR family transcriptional regulator [Mycobacterium sp. M23085]|uniref:TetR/AcrR family transcriptional regulator n=1 Tax=Mycobacterium sp. M23085 TaxID=3378087 RepID=UPI0038781567
MGNTGTRSGPRPARRTQAERSAAMRTRLLDATIDCLVSYGYAGTTTQRVAAMAGVTRGAQVHHFRSKEDLVVAAIEHLAQQRAEAVLREIPVARLAADPVTTVLNFLWESHQGPMFTATVELWVAARTDPVLAEHVQRVEPLVNETLAAAMTQLWPASTEGKQLRDAVYTAMDALRGILLGAFVEHGHTRAHRRWKRACVYLAVAMRPLLDDRR